MAQGTLEPGRARETLKGKDRAKRCCHHYLWTGLGEELLSWTC